MSGKVKGLVERLNDGETVIVAEGYLFDFQRRGYLKAGAFTPEVVLEHPELVKRLYEEYVHAGSDVVLAFTYYAHREKLRLIGREDEIVKLNKEALRLARAVADENDKLMAGNISNTNIIEPGNEECKETIRQIFKEQITWAVEGGADFIVGETFCFYEEAKMALEAIKEYGGGLPAVITLATHQTYENGKQGTMDGLTTAEACRRLEEAGAAVVGVNCSRGPTTMLPVVEDIKKACKGPVAALPVVYRTNEKEPTFQSLTDPRSGKKLFPINLDCASCSRKDIVAFGKQCKELGIQYVGLCCGNSAHFTRTLAESLGRKPPASRYSPNMKQHSAYGDRKSNNLKEFYENFSKDL